MSPGIITNVESASLQSSYVTVGYNVVSSQARNHSETKELPVYLNLRVALSDRVSLVYLRQAFS